MKMSKVILFVLLIAVVLFAAPILVIWSLNTLFPVLAIPYTLYTWAAVVILGAYAKANIGQKSS